MFGYVGDKQPVKKRRFLFNNKSFPVKLNQTINNSLPKCKFEQVNTMRSECFSCKKTFSGSGLIVSLNSEERTYCADCLWKFQKEYSQKKSCENCSYFDEESCEKRGKPLVPVKAGFNTYFVQAETCKEYTTEQKAVSKKKNELSEDQKEAAALVKKLSEKGQNLTFYCCHCGAPLKIGAKTPKIPNSCPRCQGDLEIISFAKFIKQHQS